MGRLPPYHVARPRLSDQCRADDARVIVLEAPAGYGKSVLAAELVDVWGSVPVELILEEGPVSGRLLAGRMRAAVARAGFRDAAGAAGPAGDDPAGAIDAMLASLAGESCAIVIDDAHHAARDAAALIDRIAGAVELPQHLVVLARNLPGGSERLRRAESICLTGHDLALRAEETLELCREGFGLDVTPEETRMLDAATGGWTAAAVLAASRARRGARPLREIAQSGRRDEAADELDNAVASMLEEVLSALGPDRPVLARIAPLPLLDEHLLGSVTGDPNFLERAMSLGLPLTPAGSGWWELSGPVRDHLASLGPADAESLVRAAHHYATRGRLGSALELLLAEGEDEAAALLLADADLRAIEIDVLELFAYYERLPDPVRSRYPWATFAVARACGIGALLGPRGQLLAQLQENMATGDDPVLLRAVDAERAIDLLNVNKPLDGEALGREVLESAGPGEQMTRARAMLAIGFGLCSHRDVDGRLSESSLREAARYFDQVSAIYRSLGYREAVSGVAAPRALWTELGTGRPLVALEVIDDALADCGERPVRFGRLLFHRAQVLGELGRFEEGEAALVEAERIARQQGDILLLAFSFWGRMALASWRGDAEAALRFANEVESNRGEWWDVVGAEFLAEAADSLDRVGQVAMGREYLARAKNEPHAAERWIALAECAVLARHGDPALAEERLAAVHRHGIFPKEYWRVALLRAFAAWRRGDKSAGVLAAKAFEEAARLGQPQAPLIREREVAESLLALASETGSPAAVALEASSLPVSLAVLGRFELSRGGREVPLGSGQAVQLLKLVAVRGPRIQAEGAIEALWRDIDPATGRNRLRTVLGRLRDVAGDVISREGDLLVLSDEVRLDLAEFRREAKQALAFGLSDAGAAVAVASSAIARYRGELLPDDHYEDWTDASREEARRTMLDLLDLCAEVSAERGDLDEARRMVQRTIELAPYDDDRYLRAASILDEQGKRGAALSVIRRARSTLATLGVPLPAQLLDLQDSIMAAGVSQRS
jgi:ATP/maltotriose-dependent transcriptional regulator MalT